MFIDIPTESLTLGNELATTGNIPNFVSHDEEGLTSPAYLPPIIISGHPETIATISTMSSIEHAPFTISPSSIGDFQIGQNRGGSPSDGEQVWYCSECGDGPIASWNPCCANCGHAACYACTVEHK